MVYLHTLRGYRNNNPGNIERRATQWDGMSVDQSTDTRFIVFDDVRYGIRAMAKILNSYGRRGVNTIDEIVTTWAPPKVGGEFENDTAAYVRSVSQRAGLPAHAPIGPNEYPAVISAIIHHELGIQPYSQALIRQGIAMA